MKGWTRGWVLAALVTILPAAANAAPGDLDPTFGAGGIVTTSLGANWDVPSSLLLQDDGNIVAVGSSDYDGDFALVRYRPDGSLDSTFGNGGIVQTDIASYQDAAVAAVLDPTERIVAVGIARNSSGAGRVALARYHTDGSLDSSFGIGGKVVTAIGFSSYAAAVALQPDGRIVVAGSRTLDLSGNSDIAVLRYSSDGNLDPTFGSGGIVVTNIANHDSSSSVIIQPDGKIVVVGTSYSQAIPRTYFALVRYNPDGSLDPTFGTDGKALNTFTSAPVVISDEANRGVLQPDGKIVVIGRSNSMGYYGDFLLARYRVDGSLDPAFGIGGAVIDQVSTYALGIAVALQPDGKIVAAGAMGTTEWDFGIVRYTADGARDPSFGSGGLVRTAIGPFDNPAIDVALQHDGKIVATGYTALDVVDDLPSDEDFAVARYEGDPGCGNGLISTGEACDDGNETGGDGCTSDCQIEPCFGCSGLPSSCAPTSVGVLCADDENPCTNDVCSGGGICTHPAGNGGATCRAAARDCDLAEQCDGLSAACPADDVVGFGISCRTKIDACDAEEFCDGASVSCPTDRLAASGTLCRSAGGVCDEPEACDGVSPICPPDAKSTVLCRAAIDLCDIAESCDGVHDDCPADTFAPVGLSCRAAAGGCDISEICSGSSPTCPSDAHRPDTSGCDDGNPCTQSDTCQAGNCVGSDPLDCDDGNPCSADTCSPTGGCVNDDSPNTGCLTAARSSLLIKKSTDDSRDKLLWKWSRGEQLDQTDLADPISSTGYALCVYAGPTSALVADAALPAGTGWHALGSKGYTFKGTSPNGLSFALLKGGAASKSKALAKGKGAALPDPTLPVAYPVTVQLKKDASALCLESTFTISDEVKNEPGQFRAKK